MKLYEEMAAQQGAEGAQNTNPEDEVVDADFTEVKDDDKK